MITRETEVWLDGVKSAGIDRYQWVGSVTACKELE